MTPRAIVRPNPHRLTVKCPCGRVLTCWRHDARAKCFGCGREVEVRK